MPAKTRSPRSAKPAARKLTGLAKPRLYPEPLRPLNARTSHGYEVIQFAEQVGEPLLPWQKWAATHAMELLPGGQYRFRVVLVVVARQNGKSQLKRMVTLWRLFMDDTARLVLGTAQDVPQASNQWKLALATIRSCWFLENKLDTVRRVNGQESFTLKSGAEYMIRSANESAGRGFSVDELNIDELRTQKDWRAWGALSKTTMGRPNPQTWCMSNAGSDESVVLNQLRDAALSGRDESIGLFEWSAEDGCELDDPRAWRQANPALGHVVSASAIRSALGTDPAPIFRTEVLCQRVAQLDGAIDLAAWKDCADAGGTMDGLRGRLAACFDIAPDEQHSTLVVAARTPDGKIRLETVSAWKTTGEARAELPALLARIKPAAIGWFPVGPGAAFAPVLRPMKGSVELTGGKVTEACQGLADLARGRQLLHSDDPLLNAHIGGAQRLPSGDGWRFTRRGDRGHVDAAYAAAGAVYVALTMAVPGKAVFRAISY